MEGHRFERHLYIKFVAQIYRRSHSPSVHDERHSVRKSLVTPGYFTGPDKYRESLRVLRETLFRSL